MTTYISQAYILDHLRIQPRLAHHLLENLDEKPVQRSIFEAPSLRLGQGRPDGERYNDIVWIFLSAVAQNCQFTM